MKDRSSINLVRLKLIRYLGTFSVLILKVPIFDVKFMFLTNSLPRSYNQNTYFYETLFLYQKLFKKDEKSL